MRRVPIAALVVLVLVALAAPPVSAATIRRTWTAAVGTSGANGRVQLQAYMDGSGRIAYDLHSLRASSTYKVEIRAGRCSSLGSVILRPASVRTDAAGAAVIARGLSTTSMGTIWGTARTKSIAIRFIAGTSVRCGNLTFPRATRVRITAYSIDLPVIAASGYPKCNVAMYLRELSQPREPGVTYLYAHARKGMFLPLLNASKVNNGASMIGKLVLVYTSDSYVVTYRIDRVRRHVTSIQNALGVTAERLWLQTSEGPNSSYPKLIVEARPISVAKVSYAAAHPTPHPVSC